jgi:hypothetical protein
MGRSELAGRLACHPGQYETPTRSEDSMGFPRVIVSAGDGKGVEAPMVDHPIETLVGERESQRVSLPNVHVEARPGGPSTGCGDGTRGEVDAVRAVPALGEVKYI